MGRVGFEPTTYSLKGSSSTIELTTQNVDIFLYIISTND